VWQAELLFLGRQRRTGAALLGDTQRRLLADPPCALWFQGGTYLPPKRLLLTAAGGAELDALPFASRVAARLGLRLDRRIGLDGDALPEDVLVLAGAPSATGRASELLRREVAFLVVPPTRTASGEPDELESDGLESVGFSDPDAGRTFDLG
jgi:hypothetical protein